MMSTDSAKSPTSSTSPSTVRVTKIDQVLVVTIDRPEARNAVDRPTALALADAFREFDADDELHVAILTGSGGTFCAGADLKAISTNRGNRVDLDVAMDGPMGPTRMQLGKPVIAAIEGYAVAGGLELAAWCDLRVMASNAVVGVFCRRWGVPLVDGGTIRLVRLLGESRAMDLILTGRAVGAEEAERIGFANRVVAPGRALDTALELANQMGNFPQRCLRSDRMSVYEQWNLSMNAALAREVELGQRTIRSGETREGAARFESGEGRHGQFS